MLHLQSLVFRLVEKNITSLLPYYKKYLSSCHTVLDIGCGNGMQAKLIQKSMPTLKIRGLDIGNYLWQVNKDIPLTTYDGEKIPFSGNSFDASLLLFTLHHTTDSDQVFTESVRVSKKYLLIFEEVYTNFFQKIAMTIYDIVVNTIIFQSRISLPHFKTEEEWQKLFQNQKLSIVKKLSFAKPWYYPPQRILFVLKK